MRQYKTACNGSYIILTSYCVLCICRHHLHTRTHARVQPTNPPTHKQMGREKEKEWTWWCVCCWYPVMKYWEYKSHFCWYFNMINIIMSVTITVSSTSNMLTSKWGHLVSKVVKYDSYAIPTVRCQAKLYATSWQLLSYNYHN